MKVLVGIADHEPEGRLETGSHELVVVARRRVPLARDAFVGSVSSGRATLARVVETPECFRPRSTDAYLLHTLALIAELPVGAIVRPRIRRSLVSTAERREAPEPGDWELEIEGPN